MKIVQKPIFLVLFFTAIFLIIASSLTNFGHSDDSWYWFIWIENMMNNGFVNSYNMDDIDYNPLFLYILYPFSVLLSEANEIFNNLRYLKSIVLIFDFIAPIMGVYLLFKDWKKRLLYPLIFLLSIPYLYNTIFWAQVDAFYTSLVFLSLLFLYKNKPILGIAFFVLAYLAKMQAIIFIPLLLLGLLVQLRLKPKKIFVGILVAVIITALVVLPFVIGGSLQKIININFNAVGRYPYVSLSAYNVWYLLMPLDSYNFWSYTDDNTYLGLTYKLWGLIMFFISSLAALLPMILISFKNTFNKVGFDYSILKQVFLTAGVVTLLFFFFNTQMHERYAHPAMLFFGFYLLLSRDWVPYVLSSLAYVLNMESVLRYLKNAEILDQKYSVLIFMPKFIAILFLIAIIWGLVKIYRNFDFKKLVLKEA